MKFDNVLKGLARGAVLFSSLAASAAPSPAMFESLAEQYVLREAPVGTRLVSRFTATFADDVTEASLRSFLERLSWRRAQELRKAITGGMTDINTEFAEFRSQSNRAADAPLIDTERDFLAKATAKHLGTARIEQLLEETTRLLEIPHSDPIPSRSTTGTSRLARSARAFAEESAELMSPSLNQANAKGPNMKLARQTFPEKMSDRFHNLGGFYRAFRFSEGELKTLFGREGRQFTWRDLSRIRKYNRLLGSLNEYSRTRLIIKAFTLENPILFARLNEMTAEATAQYAQGMMVPEEYLATRAAAAKELKLNDIVIEAERRMLTAVHRVRQLGGGRIGSHPQRSLLDLSEDNIATWEGYVVNAEREYIRTELALSNARNELAASRNAFDEPKDGLIQTIRKLEGKLTDRASDVAIWKMRIRQETQALEKMYLEFVTHFDTLHMFANLRSGRINSELVQVFDLPDPFVPAAHEITAWKDFYARALFNSTHELVLGETRLFYRTHSGETRKFIRDMNKMTGQYFGQKFTDGPLGQEFLSYSRHVAEVVAKRIFKYLGLPGAAGLAATYHEKLWAYIFTDKADPEDQADEADVNADPAP